MKFEIKHRNERDVEGPALLASVADLLTRENISSILDVGANYSYATYAPALRRALPGAWYHACDLEFCTGTARLVDGFDTCDVRDLDKIGPKLDFVSCISVLEHVGVKQPGRLPSFLQERFDVFTRLCQLTRKRLFVTVPFGAYGIFPREYANFTADDIKTCVGIAKDYGLSDVTTRYYYNQFSPGGHPWEEIDITRASQVELLHDKGVQCVCLFEATKA